MAVHGAIRICLGMMLASAVPAAADDAPFLNTDPVSVLGKGEHAVQQWLFWGNGHSHESYNAFESLTEFDYGLSNRIQLSLTLATDWDRTRPPGERAQTTSALGVQGEAIIVLAPTAKNIVGLAVAIDPSWTASSRGIALRLLLTKYFAGFENVLNINFENAWDKDGAGGWNESGAVTLNYGLAHALSKHWTVAIEAGNQFAFSRLVSEMNFADSGTTLYVGPTAEYECSLGVLSFGVQAQLPLASGGAVSQGYRDDAERWHAGFRFTHTI